MDKNTVEERVISSLLAEHRSARRWKNVRFFIWLAITLLFLFFLFSAKVSNHAKKTLQGSYVSLIRLNGMIMPGAEFSAKRVIPLLNKAFSDSDAKGVVLLMNSPGGSPVQASIIHDKIEFLKKKYRKTVIVVAEDSLASGAYLVATAADKIFVNNDTLTGSIGVIMSGFGFKDAIEKLGISRRVFTAGSNKDRLDPFRKLNPADIQKIDTLLGNVHQHFIADVMNGRGNKLKGSPKELFSGDFWTGAEAVKLGLADQTANPWEAMKQTFGTMRYVAYTPHRSFLQTIANDVSSELHIGLLNHTHLEAVL